MPAARRLRATPRHLTQTTRPVVDIFTPDSRPILHRAAEVPASGPPPAAVDRSTLRAILLDAASNVRFGLPVVGAIQDGNEVEVGLGDGTKVTCGLLIAADGVSSPLRRKLLPAHDPRPLGTIAIYGKARWISVDTRGCLAEFCSSVSWA